MALSKIDICNQALLKVGADLIASLDTSTATDDGAIRTAKMCNALYDQALDEILRIYTWNCCVARATPTLLGESPAFGYDYAFQLPNDCLRVIRVFDNTSNYSNRLSWVIEGKKILCDTQTVYIKYIARPDDVGILDSLCASALICNLAIKLSVTLQLDVDWQGRLIDELYNVILPSARSIDTIENKELLLEESEWIAGRDYDSPY